MSCWDPIACTGGDETTRQIGPLTLRVRRQDDEWHAALSYQTAERGLPLAQGPATESVWRRWIVADGSGGLTLTPALPDRAVVVRPKFPLSLAVGEAALFYVTVPAWVRLTALPTGAVLLDTPSTLLSKIWYGDFTSGELCYSVRSRATRHLDENPEVDWRITCPVHVRNLSARDLLLERLCLHTQHLGVFEGGDRLWTPVVTAVFRGDDQIAEVDYGHEPPPQCTTPIARSQPREPASERRLWRSFRELASTNLF